MNNKWFFITIPFLMAAIVLICVFFAGKYTLNKLFSDMCGNEIISNTASPNGDKMAYIFQRDCGATTDYSYQLSIIGVDEKLPNESGNTFVSDKEFHIEWINNKKLLVRYSKSSNTFEMDKNVDWTEIQYIGK